MKLLLFQDELTNNCGIVKSVSSSKKVKFNSLPIIKSNKKSSHQLQTKIAKMNLDIFHTKFDNHNKYRKMNTLFRL